jgi:hypothetical protein
MHPKHDEGVAPVVHVHRLADSRSARQLCMIDWLDENFVCAGREFHPRHLDRVR